ncbi:MAG: hypothetical protein A7316_05865 [Candidatus Altiarchaeales archaeon WOR_SM1_86-2]|nr:MAG: hypothetical protein A7316_05865 [Candidatus Altiarchaeales archaeon WOR_SM1_86-2]ODS40735.1 MAG: hypothetical protein A7315_07745 [Candidatus Altiarchaeales archaeon WOR_SM1_79]
MEHAADTVTIIRHFTNTGKIGKKAKLILDGAENGEHHVFISVISLVEIMYLSQKHRIDIDLDETLEIINNSLNYSIVDLTPQIVKIAESIDYPELHDKLILSTAKYLGTPLLTGDRKIRNCMKLKPSGNNDFDGYVYPVRGVYP